MGEWLEIPTEDGVFGAYLARPQAESAPAIVVIQEIFGVNEVMRAVADGFAEAGYLALCPDLFWRIAPRVELTDRSEAEWKRAFELFNAFDIDAGVRDLDITITAARSLRGASGEVGTVGFCLGGLLAFLCATRTTVDAAVGYYGVGIDRHLGAAESLNAPLMLHIAEEDQFAPRPAQEKIIAALGSRPNVTLYRYPGRDHAFARPGGSHYDAADAGLASERTLAMFSAVLRRGV